MRKSQRGKTGRKCANKESGSGTSVLMSAVSSDREVNEIVGRPRVGRSRRAIEPLMSLWEILKA